MNTIVGLWLAAPGLGTALILQWTLLRRRHRSALTKQHAKHAQQHQILIQHVQQAKRQIGQLQHDLAAARLQIKRTTPPAASQVQRDSPARNALERTLNAPSEVRRRLPTDGFADTRPFRHSDHDRNVLLSLSRAQ
jgi:hypothetical protein